MVISVTEEEAPPSGLSCVLSLVTEPGEAHRSFRIIAEVKELMADRIAWPWHGDMDLTHTSQGWRPRPPLHCSVWRTSFLVALRLEEKQREVSTGGILTRDMASLPET